MLSLDKVRNVKFSKSSIGGYKPEEVDEFIFQIEEVFESFEKEREKYLEKIKKLKENSEKYLEEASYIKDILVKAQKISDQEINDAKSKADAIINEANEKSKDIIDANESKIKEQEQVLSNMKEEITNFKTRVLNEYKNHLKILGAIEKNINSENKEEKPHEEKPNEEKLTEEKPNEEYPRVEKVESSAYKKAINEKFQKLGGIKFGDNYKVENDVESPINFFSFK